MSASSARAKIAGAYVNSALAKTEAHHQGCDDAILLNADGHVSEGSGMNLFMVRRGKLVTPAVHQNILEGITRDCVLAIAERMGLAVDERIVDRTELYACDEVFMCGTGVQIVPVIEVDQRPVGGRPGPGPVTERIMAAYDAAVRGADQRPCSRCDSIRVEPLPVSRMKTTVEPSGVNAAAPSLAVPASCGSGPTWG